MLFMDGFNNPLKITTMRKFLRLTLVCLMAMVCSSAFAQTVFNFAELYGTENISDISDQPKTIDAVTISLAQGNSRNAPAFNRSGEVRLYGGKSETVLDGCTMTVTAASGSITSIVLEAGQIDKWGVLTANVGEITEDAERNVTWTGNAAEVVFTASRDANKASVSTQNRYTKATVTVTGGEIKKSADLKFSETDIEVEQGTAFTSPTFTKATTAAVTFSSDNEDVASVNSEGKISLGGELGTAKITAKAEENDDFYAGEATCTVTVFTVDTYKKATEIVSGAKYLIVADNSGVLNVAKPVTSGYGYLYVDEVDAETDGKMKVRTDKGYDFTITAAEGGYTIMQSDGRYMYQTGTFNSFNVSANPTSGNIWTIEPEADGTFIITNVEKNKYVQFDTQYKSFGCYSDDKGSLPYLYVKDDTATGITDVTVEEFDENAPVYNLAGQRVDKNAKGILIQNGKKFIRR